MTSPPRSPAPLRPRPERGARRFRTLIALVLGAVVGLAGVAAPPALAATGQITIQALDAPPPPKPTGSASAYSINFTCSAVGEQTCGDDPVIRIPLDLTSVNGETPPMETWAYGASSTNPALIASQGVEGGDYVIRLAAEQVKPGDSQSIFFTTTPPNNITPDGTTWSFRPTLDSDDMDTATAPTAAPGAATAEAKLAVSKVTNDGSNFVVRGNNVIYDITARCNAGGQTGNLHLKSGSLVDTLPAGLSFVSATPTPTSQVGQTITWDYPTPADLPTGCASGATGTRTYRVVAAIDPTVANLGTLRNEVTFAGVPIGTSTAVDRTADRTITVYDVSPANPGNFIGKTAAAPLDVAGAGFVGTYPGDWMPDVGYGPSVSNPGSAAGRFTVTVAYPASRAYTTDLIDPMPCLTDPSPANRYNSSAVTGPSDPAQEPTIDALCTDPAFHPTMVRVDAPSLGAAHAAGWRPKGITTAGTTFDLTLASGGGTANYYAVPAAHVGDVAAIRLVPDGNLTDARMRMDVFGYADAATEGGEVLHNVASGTAYPTVGGGDPRTAADDADILIEEDEPQLGVHKTFGAYRAAAGGTTAVNITGRITTTAPLTGDVVLTDYLPAEMRWENPAATLNFTLTNGSGPGAPSTTVTGNVEYLENHRGTGRDLIRITFDRARFTSGFYTLTSPANGIRVSVPTGMMTYNNEARTYVQGIGQDTAPTCGQGTTSTPADLESADPLDLDGDGETEAQNSCAWTATLNVPATGGPDFRLVKTVQGDRDASPKYSPGLGEAAENGTGEWALTWRNIGGFDLATPVIYDILPYVGDTGTVQGQATTPRGSAFRPTFVGLSGPLPSGVSVEYSQSTNPCRDEVFPDASNPTCVDDWSSTAPADPADVRALRFRSSETYQPGQQFTVRFETRLPADTVNLVAWNSGASSARFNGTWQLPAEPPKVGITAPAPLVTPVLSTEVSEAKVVHGASVRDTITLRGTKGAGGDIDWRLVGPKPAGADGTCADVDWTGAATVAFGTIPFDGDGDRDTPPTTLTAVGCYSYVVSATSALFADGEVSHPAGAPNEVVQVRPATIVTEASSIRIAPGGEVFDRVDLTGTGGGTGTLEWELVGPIPADDEGTCRNLDWSGAPTFDRGTIAVDGDGSYVTAPSSPTETGCYSYVQRLTDDSAGGPSLHAAGEPNEMFYVGRPTVSTTVSSASIPQGGSLLDTIDVRGTGGGPGTLTWRLYGPAVPGVGGTCLGLTWTSVAVVAQGTIPVTGDGTYLTPPTPPLLLAGCYGYEVTLTGENYGDPVVSPAGTPGELSLVTAPTVPQQTADVSITKTASHRSVSVGKRISYTLTATNRGPGTAENVVITDTPVSPMTFVSARTPQGRCSTGFPLRCDVGAIPPGGKVSVTVVAVPRVAGAVVNGARVATDTPNASPAREVVADARVNVKAAVRITKRASARTVTAGKRVTYTVRITNRSRVTTGRARVCDRMPSGMVLSAVRGAKVTRKGGEHCWTVPALKPGASKRYRVVARVLGGAKGTKTNRVTIKGDSVRTASARASVRVKARPVRAGGVTG